MKQRPPKRMKQNLFYVALTFDEAAAFLAFKAQKAMDQTIMKSFGKGIKIK